MIRNVNHLIPDKPKSGNDKDGDDTDNGETCDSNRVVGENDGVRVFVPLCGKTVDMAYLTQLEQVEEVVGVDAIRIAIEDFIQEQPQLNIIEVEKLSDGDGITACTTEAISNNNNTNFEHWVGKKISLHVGDFFSLKTTDSSSSSSLLLLGGGDGSSKSKEKDKKELFDAVFDRGSLVAIDPHMRKEYISIIGNLIAPGGRILLVTLEKQGTEEDAIKKGPPYSISEENVQTLFQFSDWVDTIEVLEREDIISSEPPEKVKGLDHYYEIAMLITAKQTVVIT